MYALAPSRGQMRAPPKQLSNRELIALVAMLMTLTALSIDLILPAFDEVRAEFGMEPDSSATASLITVYFIGLALPQLAYGPLSDRYGRKPLLYVGMLLYVVGAIGASLAPSLGLMLVSRFVWGVGAAGPRVVSLSIIRDSFDGDRMARVMSFVMAVFIFVPIVAPSVGAGLIAISSWRTVFWFPVVYTVLVAVWTLRLPETLRPEHKLGSSRSAIVRAVRTVVTTRQTMGYAIALTLLFGAFTSYLASSERIWAEVFDRGDQFPLIFGGIALVLGFGLAANGILVERTGVRRLTHRSLVVHAVASAALVAVVLAADGQPGFWLYVVLLTVPLAAQSFLVPNFNTLALAPVGAVAGTASAFVGALSTGGGALLGSIVDRAFDGTPTPMSIALLAAGVGAAAVIWVTERGEVTLTTPGVIDPAAAAPPLVD